MRPPFLKHWIHRAKVNPPQAPIKYLVAFQKKIDTPPPAKPATAHARTNKPRRVVLGGLMAWRIPNLAMRTKHTRDKV